MNWQFSILSRVFVFISEIQSGQVRPTTESDRHVYHEWFL